MRLIWMLQLDWYIMGQLRRLLVATALSTVFLVQNVIVTGEQLQQPNQLMQRSPTQNDIKMPLSTPINMKPLMQASLATAPNFGLESAPGQLLLPAPASAPTKALTMAPEQTSATISFGNEDPIIYLDYSTINDEILKKRTANFVYFNANFNHCRHCYRFFNIWKELAVDIRWWRQVIKLYTINCSDEDNIEMCRRAGVTQFPQVKYYWVMSNSLDRDGQRLRILGKSVHAMRHVIMDKVLDSYTEHSKLLAQRNQQQQKQQAGSNALTPAANPLISIIGQLFGSSGIAATGAVPAPSSAPLGGLASIMNVFSGKSKDSAGASGAGLSISGLINSFGGIQGVTQLMNAFMSASSMRQRLSVQPLSNNWPNLNPIEVAGSQQLIKMLPLDASKGIGALLIMETQEYLYTGPEVMLDLSPYGNQTFIARVRDERSQLSKNLTKRDDILAPALIYVTPEGESRLILTAPKYSNDEDLRRTFVRAFERRQVKYPVKRVWSMSTANNQQAAKISGDSQEDEELLNKVNQVYMNDLTNAIRISLMDQVYKHAELSDDQYNALVKYVYALINYFPFNNDGDGLKFLKRLHTWLQNQVSSMNISEYKKQFHDIDEAIQQREWVACKSLSNSKAIPSKGRKSGSLFENPAQFGKVVSNLTRLFRGQQQQMNKLKNFFSAFTSNAAPVMLNQPNRSTTFGNASVTTTIAPSSGSTSPSGKRNGKDLGAGKKDGSPIERIVEGLTSGSLGSDSSILKLISSALTVGSETGSTGKSKFAREYPCGAWKVAHVMVVNEYIKDSPRKDVKHIVLHSLYQYMLHFYTCPNCGNRISDVSGEFRLDLDEHLIEQGSSVMLLWRVHNRVNKRLESELRPGSPPKLQFPSEQLCQKCRAPKTQNELTDWHEKQVLNFLVHHYRPQSLLASTNSTESSSANSDFQFFAGSFYSIIMVLNCWCLMLLHNGYSYLNIKS